MRRLCIAALLALLLPLLSGCTDGMELEEHAFALAMALSLGATRHHKPLIWLSWTAAAGIAWSRVHLGVHFVSDVLAGSLVGIGGALTVWSLAFQLRYRRQLRVVPHIKRLRSALATAR